MYKDSNYQEKYYQRNKEKLKKQSKKYHQAHKTERKITRKKYYKENKNKLLTKGKRYYNENKEQISKRHKNYDKCHKNMRRKIALKYYYGNKKKIMKYKREYIKKNRNKIRIQRRKYFHKRRHQDTEFKIICNLRSRVSMALKQNNKSLSTMFLIGCSIDYLMYLLQEQFKKGMSWNNYGKYWHIDHIKPCISFDLNKPEEQAKCFHYNNLQPLSIHENRTKKDTYK